VADPLREMTGVGERAEISGNFGNSTLDGYACEFGCWKRIQENSCCRRKWATCGVDSAWMPLSRVSTWRSDPIGLILACSIIITVIHLMYGFCVGSE
jgi:hypothetical protein